MAQMIIDNKYGFDTVFSSDPSSPAAEYLREYHPRSLEDLYDIGAIPKHVPIEVLRKARDSGLETARTRYVAMTSSSFRDMPPKTRRQYLEASVVRHSD
jgi:hypothetical protein